MTLKMQNAFGECYITRNDNVFQYIVSDDAPADNTFDSTKEPKGPSQAQPIRDMG